MLEKKTVLVVDDTVENLDILVDLLSEYHVIDVLDGASALEVLEEQKADLILLDIMMPQMDGFEVCSRVLSNEKTKNIPVIFITAMSDEESIERAYDIGGKDYVTKPFKPKELLARVKTQLEMQSLIQKLEYMAFYDGLTQLYNRHRFFALAEEKFPETAEMSLALVDIDFFKQMNDSYGHMLGDKVLMSVAEQMRGHLGKEVLMGRIGGEKFGLLLSNGSANAFYESLETLRKAIETAKIDHEKTEISCTISVGMGGKNKWMKTFDDLVAEADRALFIAKQTGRNKIVKQY